MDFSTTCALHPDSPFASGELPTAKKILQYHIERYIHTLLFGNQEQLTQCNYFLNQSRQAFREDDDETRISERVIVNDYLKRVHAHLCKQLQLKTDCERANLMTRLKLKVNI